MKRIVTISSAVFAVLLLSSEEGVAMTKYFGRVADPVTGRAVKGAQVIVCLAGGNARAEIFSDSEGEKRAPNPVITDVGGRYAFHVRDGKYRLRILSPDQKLLYDHDDITICDPRNPRTIKANKSRPALSLNTPPSGGELNLPLM
ncbi:MAG: carboxypeptidase-like regulatory domain-containing protein, partial [Verrucomicrobiota bacterium]|nr:carboxypeptidase-like regulatory domain-containing protein [Verrucomicrobiota bacterium]